MRRSVRASAARVHAYITSHFSIGPEGGAAYVLEFTTQEVLQLPQGTFAQYHFRARAGPPARSAADPPLDAVRTDDRLHRGLLLVEHNARTGVDYGPEYVAMVFGPVIDRPADRSDVDSRRCSFRAT